MSITGVVDLATSNIRFGDGIIREVGLDLAHYGAKRVMVLADPNLTELYPVRTARESIERAGIRYTLFDRVSVEPTDASVREAVRVAQSEPFDAFVAIGGGSTIDTAKAANLYATYPAEFFDYVATPVGKAKPVPGPLKPLIAIPTTTGTGSEATGMVVFDLAGSNNKTVIGHRLLKPSLALLDPLTTKSLPAGVVASSGADVFSHAIESLTAVPYTRYEQPELPSQRPAYQGSNPISDVWALQSLRLARRFFARAVGDADDLEARGSMLLAASFAGLGFGNAGVHLPHAMCYPVSGNMKSWQPPGYQVDHAFVPHGITVILTTTSVIRFMTPTCPDRLLWAAEALGADTSNANPEDAGKILADTVATYLQRLPLPNGLAAIGYTTDTVPKLVEGTFPQERIIRICPRRPDGDDLAQMFEESMVIY